MAANSPKTDKIKPLEWIIPACFTFCAGWLIWHMSAFTLDWAPPQTESAMDRLSAQYMRNDVSPGLDGLFGGFADLGDYAALLGIIVFGTIGITGVRRGRLEQFDWNIFDRLSVFIGRVAMFLILMLVLVMLYEVVLRYAFESPTLWANELSLWIAGFVFLFSGLYAMQQRSHIRIFILYDVLPRGWQRTCDVVSTLLTFIFTGALIWGGFKEATEKFYRWETLGTAFDPPVPATLIPAIMIVVSLVALQALSNLIRDWNREPEQHSAADDIDPEELEDMRRALGADKDV